MSIFVTGATGALGTPTVAQLIRDGHRVRALATSAASAQAVLAAGAEPVRGSLFDRDTMRAAVQGAEAILHLATRIAPFRQARKPAAWLENDRIRREGTRILAEAALEAGVGVLVYPSFAPVYADGGARWLSFGDPIEPTEILRSTVDAEQEVERFTTAGGRGVVLRMAGVYGPHSAATADVIRLARKGISGFAGPADAYQPMVWDGDAAAALVAAIATDDLAGGYDVADDRPLTREELAAELAAAVGRRTVRRPPTWLLRASLGERMSFAFRSQRVSNERFRKATGWAPEVVDAAAGLHRLRETSGD